jgi:hypothetical protein
VRKKVLAGWTEVKIRVSPGRYVVNVLAGCIDVSVRNRVLAGWIEVSVRKRMLAGWTEVSVRKKVLAGWNEVMMRVSPGSEVVKVLADRIDVSVR